MSDVAHINRCAVVSEPLCIHGPCLPFRRFVFPRPGRTLGADGSQQSSEPSICYYVPERQSLLDLRPSLFPVHRKFLLSVSSLPVQRSRKLFLDSRRNVSLCTSGAFCPEISFARLLTLAICIRLHYSRQRVYIIRVGFKRHDGCTGFNLTRYLFV